MAQPKLDAMHMFSVMEYRDKNPMATNEELLAYAKKLFPRDAFVASPKFLGWLDNGRGSFLEREMHKNLVAMVSLTRLAEESQQNLEDRERAIAERDEARELAEKYRGEAEGAKLNLALMTPPPVESHEAILV